MLWNPINGEGVAQPLGSVVRFSPVPDTVLRALADTVANSENLAGVRLADVNAAATGLVRPLEPGTAVRMSAEPALNDVVYLSASAAGEGTSVAPLIRVVLGRCCEKNQVGGVWYASLVPVVKDDWQNYVPVVTLVGGAGNVVPQYLINEGRFYRKGKIVFCEIRFDGPTGSNGAGSGQINISLPIPSGAGMVTDYKPGGHFHNGASETLAHVQVPPSSAVLELFQQTSATATSPATGSDQSNAGTRMMRLSFFYEID